VAQQSIPTVGGNKNMTKIILPAIRNFVIGAVIFGAILCLLAGTFSYWQGWVFAIFFVGLTLEQGVYLAIHDPELLKRRTQVAAEGESRAQKLFIILGLGSTFGLMFFSALDHRFGWSQMSPFISLVGDVLIVLSFVLYRIVFRENSYAASSIKTFQGQKVISTGPYALVRHPKYVGDLLLLVGMPLALGSWWAFVFLIVGILGLAWRILDEEKLLKQDLPGYVEYTQKVHYRLVPGVW